MDFASLQHSVFLQSLGSAILNSLWQGFILWFLYETISASYKTSSAKFKNTLSTILVFVAFIWFNITFISKLINHQAIAAGISLGITHAQITTQPSSVFEKLISYAGSSVPYLSVAYIFLLLFLMAKLFTAYRYVYIISNKRLISPPESLASFTSKVAAQMKIPLKVRLWISHHIDVPATIGSIKPVILIPFASLNNLTASQLEAIILHELSHIKRNDYIINIMVSVIETVLFFNPFIALLSTVIKRERENCCDDFVLQYQYDPLSYASALLRLEQSRVNTMKLAIGAVSGKKQLLSRIKRITNGHVVTRQFNYGQNLLALLFVTVIIASIAWLSPQEKKPLKAAISVKHATQAKTKNIIFVPQTPKSVITRKENPQPKNVKDFLIKKDEDTFNDTDMPLPFTEADDLKAAANVASQNWKEALTQQVFNLKNAHFFFDSSKMKLPTSINVQGIPFQNMAFNIDLSKIDLAKLNENLKQAYKGINAIDWRKISNEIQESLSKMKVENFGSNFPSSEEIQLYLEEAENLSKRRDRLQRYNSDILRQRIQNEIRRNSINMPRVAKATMEYTDDKPQTKNTSGNFYTVKNLHVTECDNSDENIAPVISYKSLPGTGKNVTIIVSHTSKHNLKKGETLQFSFNGELNAPTGPGKVISVEVNDAP